MRARKGVCSKCVDIKEVVTKWKVEEGNITKERKVLEEVRGVRREEKRKKRWESVYGRGQERAMHS